MSLWKRFQRIGMKAAKLQFTASIEELSLTVNNNYVAKSIIIVFTRRGRRFSSKPFTLQKSLTEKSEYKHVWSVPENMEFVTTLYRNDKDISFLDKEWTIHIEDVGDVSSVGPVGVTSTRKRVLAARNLNVSEFAADLPTQNSLKILLRPASKKISSAQLFFTLHGLMVKSGEATDEDMMSVASMMSLTYASGPYGGDFNAIGSPTMSNSFRNDIAGVTAKMQALERCPPTPVKEEDEDHSSPTKEAEFFPSPPTFSSSKNTPVVSPQKQNGSNLSSPVLINSGLPPTGAATKSTTLRAVSQTEQDLLVWCRVVTAGYANVHIADLSTSFRSGLALCAIIHHFYPSSLDFNALDKDNALENVRIAFDIASRLGVPRVLDASEVAYSKRPLDCLSMMTYLHQLRTILSLGANPETQHPPSPPTIKADAKNEDTDGKSSSSISEKTIKPPVTESISLSPNFSNKSGNTKSKPAGNASMRYGQLLDRARLLLKPCSSSYGDMDNVEMEPFTLNQSPLPSLGNGKSVSPLKEEEELSLNEAPPTSTSSIPSASLLKTEMTPLLTRIKVRKLKLSNMKLFSHTSANSHPYSSPKNQMDGDVQNQATGNSSNLQPSMNEIESEMNALNREQELLDAEAPGLERKLREVMQTGGVERWEEEMLMRRWFQLVSKRNALLHRSYQLSIMEKENDLQKTTELLKSELRELIEKPDDLKTVEERKREEYLLREVVEVVNERDEIIQELDYQEQALVDEVALGLRTDQIAQETFGVPTNDGRSCSIQ